MPYPSGADWRVENVGTVDVDFDGEVTIADGDDEALGSKADTPATDDTGTFSLIALFKRSLQRLTSLIGIAHDDADGGNPILMGAHALSHGASPTAVAAGDRTRLYANRDGVLFTIGGHPNISSFRVRYTGAQTDAALFAVSPGTKIAVTRLLVTTDDANSNAPSVVVGFGATTTPTGAGVLGAQSGIQHGGGFETGNGAGIIGVGGDGEEVRVTSADPGGAIDITISYFPIPS